MFKLISPLLPIKKMALLEDGGQIARDIRFLVILGSNGELEEVLESVHKVLLLEPFDEGR